MSFGSTLTGGIQDISAFLPILGTDQCESHIGEALTEGYLYAAATPLSLFGCLGIVKAAIGILMASIQIGPLNGAKMLRNAGFELQGPCAAMVGAVSEDPNDQYIEYAADSQFLALVSKLNIRTSKLCMLTVENSWNLQMTCVAWALSILAITPYLPIIIHKGPNFDNLFYPILRIVGSVICVVVSQFLLQMRIAQSLNALAEDQDVSRWNKEGISGWLFRGLLAVGSCATAVGYVGCFTVVQNSDNRETLLWLGLEALLSLLRLWLWGLNPKFDDGTHIYIWVAGTDEESSAKFSVSQATTDLHYERDIVTGQKPFMVIRDRKFLRDMRAMLQTPSLPLDSPSWHPSRVPPYIDPIHKWAISYATVPSDNGLCLLTSVIDLAENAAFVLTQKSGSDNNTVCHSAFITTSLADGSMHTKLADLRLDCLDKFQNLRTHSQKLIDLLGAPDLHIKAAKVTWTGELIELQTTEEHAIFWRRVLSDLSRQSTFSNLLESLNLFRFLR